MRKKIIFLSLVFILSASMVFAQGTENKNSDAGNPESTQEEKGQRADEQTGKSNGETIGEQIRQQVKAVNMEQLKEMIKDKKQEMNQEFQAMKDKKKQEVYKNQNKVREAVHALLSMEDLLTTEESAEDNGKGIGFQVSAIAREFNNSVQKTIQAEEKIQKRNMVVGFFFGGDEEAAEDILQETNKNKEKIQQLKDLKQQCDCDEMLFRSKSKI
jgi:hypothetical protein